MDERETPAPTSPDEDEERSAEETSKDDDRVDEESKESFPASDPPSY